jgi:hypothetical protein
MGSNRRVRARFSVRKAPALRYPPQRELPLGKRGAHATRGAGARSRAAFLSRRCTAIALCLLMMPSTALAGAWTLPQGSGQMTATATINAAERAFVGSQLTRIPRYEKNELNALIEYGLSDRLTAIVNPSLQHIGIAAPTNATRNGFGYSELGGRYWLLGPGEWVASAQALVRIPGTHNHSNPAAIGHADPEADLRGLLGFNFKLGSMPGFVDLQLAYRYRAGAPPDELRADGTIGLRVAPKWLLLAQSFNVISRGAGSPPFRSQEYSKAQFSVVYDITPSLALQVGGFTTFAGRNALQENAAILGVWYKF